MSKIRVSFISNSSSSSFICFGVMAESLRNDKYSQIVKNGKLVKENVPSGTEQKYIEEEGLAVGLMLGGGTTDDGSFGVQETDLKTLSEYAAEFEKMVGVTPKLFGGIYCC